MISFYLDFLLALVILSMNLSALPFTRSGQENGVSRMETTRFVEDDAEESMQVKVEALDLGQKISLEEGQIGDIVKAYDDKIYFTKDFSVNVGGSSPSYRACSQGIYSYDLQKDKISQLKSFDQEVFISDFIRIDQNDYIYAYTDMEGQAYVIHASENTESIMDTYDTGEGSLGQGPHIMTLENGYAIEKLVPSIQDGILVSNNLYVEYLDLDQNTELGGIQISVASDASYSYIGTNHQSRLGFIYSENGEDSIEIINLNPEYESQEDLDVLLPEESDEVACLLSANQYVQVKDSKGDYSLWMRYKSPIDGLIKETQENLIEPYVDLISDGFSHMLAVTDDGSLQSLRQKEDGTIESLNVALDVALTPQDILLEEDECHGQGVFYLETKANGGYYRVTVTD